NLAAVPSIIYGLLALGQGIASSVFGAPGRATGGPVSAGRAYRVGERGPEYFVPTSSGRIETGGSARTIAITVNVRGDAGSEPKRLEQTGRQIARAVRRAVAAGED
ncbi:MAG: tail tape measure protein, partial [Sphingopyxis sp.]|nr:tail tape measure protein [Sphingopyxis sp.]